MVVLHSCCVNARNDKILGRWWSYCEKQALYSLTLCSSSTGQVRVSLVVSNLANTITESSIVSLWFMPVNILLTFIIGSALGWILVKATKTPRHLLGLVIGCCAAGNLGNLLLIIIPAVCEEKNSPFGDSSTCSTNGEAYASLSMAIGAVYIWSYVYNIMRAKGSNNNGSAVSIKHSNETSESFLECCTEELLPNDFPSSKGYESQVEISFIGPEHKTKVPITKMISQRVKNLTAEVNLKMLFAPSTIATIVGLIIGVVSPIRKLMIGDGAPLRVMESSASILGEAAIPSMTLIVGANLLKGLRSSGLNMWLIIGILVVRYIALPLLGVAVVKAAYHFGLVGTDPLYQFVLMLQYALPSAMAIGTITQLFEVGESECSVIMLWIYAVASLSLTLWATYFMWLVS
ncbi:unnamed protein product [Ilex paraguariensis]|uniref:Protein PIN-LIKES 3-like n=1 Tax=Ilex paraguariensis TaxID=185542 RepID=A0ABC8QU04_9AQUA